ncbi:MAG: carboxylating nicotinate-nucleotide diphosphorylase [Gammaproteobacteria bacterium]|nr:carboxylating nicotinate-nucleotide diphosphorylase [Gammaproteobacteria bacterium]MCI0591727.1 carboxylating nicotinate-nucleotide diphosphorylase [Gammaproteobacteria bacterium]
MPPRLPDDIDAVVSQALREDLGEGDLTALLITEEASASAHVRSREAAILCGTAWFDRVFQQLDARVQITWHLQDGQEVSADQTVCTLLGPTHALLSGERTGLNFLQTLSGTATATRAYVEALRGIEVKLLDTRKTIPGLRNAQKYAVLCGGGHNHRIGLYDGILIKENHLLASGGIQNAVRAAKAKHPDLPVEVEVETLNQLEEAIEASADIVLLDNFAAPTLRKAVALTRGRAKLEASGSIELSNVREIAKTGVDFISIGSLTKHLHAIDMSMHIEG